MTSFDPQFGQISAFATVDPPVSAPRLVMLVRAFDSVCVAACAAIAPYAHFIGRIGGWPLARSGPLGEVLTDVARFHPAVLAPVGVPVGPVGAAGTPALTAFHVLEAVADLRFAAALGRGELWSLGVDEQTADEDHQPPEVELVQGSDLSDELPVDRHREVLPRLRT